MTDTNGDIASMPPEGLQYIAPQTIDKITGDLDTVRGTSNKIM